MANCAHIVHKHERRKIACFVLFFPGGFWGLNYLKPFHAAHVSHVLFLGTDRYQEFLHLYFSDGKIWISPGERRAQDVSSSWVGLCFFSVSPVLVVVPGTHQVLSKCFLGQYLTNVSEKSDNNNAGCERSSAKLSVQNFILSPWDFEFYLFQCLMLTMMSFLKFGMTSTPGHCALLHGDFTALLSL